MKKNTILVAALTAGLSTLALSSASLAQTVAVYGDLDADTSGSLDFGETSVAYGGLTQAQFTAADVNGDGVLTELEFNALATAGVSVDVPEISDTPMDSTMTPPNFKDVDANSDGSVSLSEAGFVYGGITLAHYTKADVDGNGTLNEGEFNSLATMGISMSADTSANANAMAPEGPADFKTADGNSDGSIDFAEASVQHDGLTQAQFTAADVDGNGSLNEGEYASLAM